MEYKEIINRIKPELDKTVSFLDKELSKVRTGRATPALVEDVVVECFGQKFPLKQLAAISVPETKLILIQPWDKSYTEPIVRALENTGVGANPVVDKDSIRINLPALSEEYRKELIHLIADKQEQSRKTMRHWREQAWSELQEKTKLGEIREDDKFRGKDALQELIDEYHDKIEQIGEKKKKEMME